VRLTNPEAESRLRERLDGGPLAALLDVRPARFSLVELEQQQVVAHHLASQAGAAVDSQIDVSANRVELFTPDASSFASSLAGAAFELPEGIALVPVARLAEQDVVRGGVHGTGCTGGFTVRAGNGDLGISTAGHCGNTQTFAGNTLPFRTEDTNTNQDVRSGQPPAVARFDS